MRAYEEEVNLGSSVIGGAAPRGQEDAELVVEGGGRARGHLGGVSAEARARRRETTFATRPARTWRRSERPLRKTHGARRIRGARCRPEEGEARQRACVRPEQRGHQRGGGRGARAVPELVSERAGAHRRTQELMLSDLASGSRIAKEVERVL